MIDDLVRGLQRALRHPGFALGSSLTLGLALGANLVAFVILYGYLLRPLPYAAPGELLTPREQLVKIGLLGPLVSAQLYDNLAHLPEFTNAALYHADSATVAVGGVHQFEPFLSVTPSLFPLLGVRPLIGSTLSGASGAPDGPREAVLSYAYWQRAFNGSPQALGKTLEANGESFRIVGVMPRSFVFPDRDAAFWVPFVVTPALSQDPNVTYEMLIRRPPGWSLARVDSLLAGIRDRLIRTERASRQAEDRKLGFRIDAVPYREVLLSGLGGAAPFLGLWAATLALLMLAVLNTLNLALARQQRRVGELQLREILGAHRQALARSLIVEHTPILVGTAIVGASFALGGIHLLRVYGLPSTNWPFNIEMNPACTTYLLGLSVLIFATIASATAISALLGKGASAALQELAARSTAGRAFKQVQRVLAAAQVCVALVLVISGFLFTRSLLHLVDRPLHFEPEHVSVATVMLPQNVSPLDFWQRARAAFQSLPGVSAAGLTDMIPFGNDRIGSDFAPYGEGSKAEHGWFVSASPEVFAALGTRLLAGQVFVPGSKRTDATDVLVSAALAQHFFGRTNVVGEAIQSGPMRLRIVGVLPTLPWGMDPVAHNRDYAVYMPLATAPTHQVHIVIQSKAASVVLWPAIRHAIAVAQPNAAISQLRSMRQIMQDASVDRAALTWLILAFGVLALIVAVFGVYAIIDYGTRLRLYEFAIRQVLGATPRGILGLILKEVATLFVAGGIVGGLLAFSAAKALSAELYGVGTLDPMAYLGGLAVIGTAVICAALPPAWRATQPSCAAIMRE